MVLEAALRHAKRRGAPVLIEATCNQVNQDGGYTGQTPAGFRDFVRDLAAECGLDPASLILGGDHLGPNPWTGLPADAAIAKAEVLVADFAAAGYAKIHLDASMRCADDPPVLDDGIVAARAARLAAAAEAAAARSGHAPPVYVIGTEVPVPGGATDAAHHLVVTTPEAAENTLAVHEAAFRGEGLGEAFGRVIALVVQPGVEFGNASVDVYDPEKAARLSAMLDRHPGLVFEAHSTDYQPAAALAGLVRDGFAILKVGPWLTFALREALYGLDAIAAVLVPGHASLREAMEKVLLSRPDAWSGHVHGTPDQQAVLRHYGYSDRIRYVWPDPAAGQAVAGLMRALDGVAIPQPLIGQFLAPVWEEVVAGRLAPEPRALLLASVERVLDRYAEAIS
jgi:D-tagatose-1,6-bisphosphate aldolase subunit GatZ/KbaZ